MDIINYTKIDNIKYKHKYLKYKNKYLQLKIQHGGLSCFGLGCVSNLPNATIDPVPDFDTIIPTNKIYREKPKANANNIDIDEINLDDGSIDIREKPLTYSTEKQLTYSTEKQLTDSTETIQTNSSNSSNSFIDFITGKRNNTILTDPNSISPFECKNKTELKKYEINKNLGVDIAKTNLSNNEMKIKADLQCNIDFIKMVVNKFEEKLLSSEGKLKNNVIISIADQEHFIEAFNNINYIYKHIHEHTLEHNKLKLELSELQTLNYFQNVQVNDFTQRQIIMINKKNPLSRFITHNYNNINKIIASFETYINYGNSYYVFKGSDKFTK
jgi:hypothetical protein